MAEAEDDDHQIGYQALPRGVPVHASGGEQVGTVHRVLDNAREHIFDGIVITTENGRRFVDAPEVGLITRRRVMLTIDAEEARALPEQPGALGSMQIRAKRAGPQMAPQAPRRVACERPWTPTPPSSRGARSATTSRGR